MMPWPPRKDEALTRLGHKRFRRAAAVAAACVGSAAWATPAVPAGADGGWLITVYYTAVASFHHGPPTSIRGCPDFACSAEDQPLGTYPKDFLDAVHDEGTGRIDVGDNAGQYLNWSYDVGYWLDTAPRGADGEALQPFRSAAHDALPYGTTIALTDCGTTDDHGPPPADVCGRLRSGGWVITDRFTPGFGGARHLDLYIGEETGPNFTRNPMYITLLGASVQTGR